MIIPKQWHIYVVNLEPRVRTKPSKQRPCLSIQPNEFGLSGLESSVVLPRRVCPGLVIYDPLFPGLNLLLGSGFPGICPVSLVGASPNGSWLFEIKNL